MPKETATEREEGEAHDSNPESFLLLLFLSLVALLLYAVLNHS